MVARRRTSLIEDIFDMLQQLPWYVGIIFAGVFWLVGQIFAAKTGTSPIDTAFRPFLKQKRQCDGHPSDGMKRSLPGYRWMMPGTGWYFASSSWTSSST